MALGDVLITKPILDIYYIHLNAVEWKAGKINFWITSTLSESLIRAIK